MSVGKVCGYVQISVARCTDTGGASAAQNDILEAFSGSGDTLWMTASDVLFCAHHKLDSLFFPWGFRLSEGHQWVYTWFKIFKLAEEPFPVVHLLEAGGANAAFDQHPASTFTRICLFRHGLHVITTYQIISWVFQVQQARLDMSTVDMMNYLCYCKIFIVFAIWIKLKLLR